MSTAAQIIPAFNSPHIMTVINDNTVRTSDVATGDFALKSINVFSSPKGRDNVLIEKTSAASYLSEFGTPSMAYGQASYMPYVSLTTGYNSCYCMRVMPEDATYANAVLMARVKFNDKNIKISKANPKYSSDPTINPRMIDNPEYEEMYIDNPYKGLTVDQLLDLIGYDEFMPNIDFDPSIPVSLDNPVKVANIYRIYNGGRFADEPSQTLDAADFTTDNTSFVSVDGRKFTNDVNIFADMDSVVNIAYDADIPETIENPDYEPETIQDIQRADRKVHVSYAVKALEGITSIDEIDGKLATLLSHSDEEDAEGYVEIPVACFYSLGRGVYGDFIVTLSTDSQSDKNNAFKNYALKLVSSDNDITEAYTRVCLYDQAINRTTSLFISDILDASDAIGCNWFTAGYEELVEFINEHSEAGLDETNMDILFGKTKANKAIDGLVVEKVKPTDIDLTTGSLTLQLSGGSDGSLALDAANRQATLNALYVKAFEGKLDRSITSKKRVPSNFIFDANYDEEVKTALKKLIVSEGRGSTTQGYIDGGILNTQSELLEWIEEQSDAGSFLYSKDPFHFQVKDPFTGKKITVTATYFLAGAIARHITVNGLNQPFARSQYAKLSGVVKNSLKPVLDDTDQAVAEALYNAGVNAYVAIGENEFMRSTAITSQRVVSDLSLESNVRVLQAILSDLEKMNESNIYNFAEQEDRNKYQKAGDRLLANYESMFREAAIVFDMTEYEEENNILHCYLDIRFKDITERIIQEIDINPRV